MSSTTNGASVKAGSRVIARPIYSKHLVDRRRELDELSRRFEDAAKGAGSAVLVCGEAGIGKTRLLEEFRHEVIKRQGLCASGQCLEHVQSPFGPFLELLRALHESAPEHLDANPFRRRALARLLPELGEPQDRSRWIEEERRAQLDAITGALQVFASRSPLVATIEDLQWADTASLDLIQHLLGALPLSRLLLVVSIRTEGLPQDHAVRAALAHYARSKCSWKIELGPLNSSDLHVLIGNALTDPGLISPETMQSICTVAEGNPFFAEELLKSALLQAPGSDSERALPQTIAQAVRERVTSMGPQAYHILSTAAAVGRRFTAATLAELAGVSLEDLFPIMKQARDLQIIVSKRAAVMDEFEFRHALIQEALYDELLANEQQQLHERIGVRLESSSSEGPLFVELAYHWWRARNYDKAAHYNEMAGDAAAELYAFGDAALFYERAVAASQELCLVRPDLLIKLGDALLFAGSGERSKAAYQKALDHYEAQGSVGMMAETCVAYGRMCFDIGYYADARAMVEKALALLEGATRSPLYFSAQVLLSLIYFREADPRKSLAQLDKADQFDGERSAHDVIALNSHRGLALWLLGDYNAAVHHFQEALKTASASDDVLWQISVLGNMGLCLAGFGQRERAETSMREALAIAEKRHVHGFTVACCLLQYASITLNFGALQEARELIQRVLATGVAAIEVQIDAASYGLTVGLLLDDEDLIHRCSRVDLLESALTSGVRRQIAWIAKGFVELYVARNDVGKATELLHRVVEIFKSMPDEAEEEILPYVAAYGSAQDQEAAAAMLQRRADKLKTPEAQGQVLLFEAYVAHKTGDTARAEEIGDKVATIYREMRRPHLEAVGLELAGHSEAALAIYRSIGDVRDARRLEQLLSPPNRRGRSKNELTERERQVARLIAEGKSNGAIAELLVISERTVENHVASIFQKLDVSSRSAVAARIARQTATENG